MTNALARETSPYLLQHAENPVAWLPWGDEAFARARLEDKPLFLSIGYAACHWCHVMAHESFEDQATADVLNREFIPVKVDREERPDVDGLYMDAVVALTGHGGWPMSVFLTPDGKPFYGGTYFPPVRRHGLPAFGEVLQGIIRAWKEDRSGLLESAGRVAEHVAASSNGPAPQDAIRPETLTAAAEGLWRSFDHQHGGWGSAPKFPAALTVEFLLRRTARTGDQLARDLAAQTLESMAAGGIYDQLGGGFHRYSVDASWTVPHFEKMLYDNALLAPVYLHAWQVTGRARLVEIARGTLDFLLAEMLLPGGGFASSLDADSEGEEGAFYIWSEAQVREALPDAARADLAKAAWGITPQGNFEGSNVLIRALDESQMEAHWGASRPTWRQDLAEVRHTLFTARSRRPRPALDDKVLTAWNGLVLIALAEGARILGDARYQQAATELAGFLLEKPWRGTALCRSWRAAEAKVPAFLEDHAALGMGLLALYQVSADAGWYTAAVARGQEILDRFSDPGGGFFDTSPEHENLLARPKTLQDSPVPSGSALAAQLLLKLAAYTGEARYEEPAQQALASMQEFSARHPASFSGWLCAIDHAIGPVRQLALIGPPGNPGLRALQQVAASHYDPNLVLASAAEPGPNDPLLLQGRTALHGEPTAYLCQHFACELPTTSPEVLAEQLAKARETP